MGGTALICYGENWSKLQLGTNSFSFLGAVLLTILSKPATPSGSSTVPQDLLLPSPLSSRPLTNHSSVSFREVKAHLHSASSTHLDSEKQSALCCLLFPVGLWMLHYTSQPTGSPHPITEYRWTGEQPAADHCPQTNHALSLPWSSRSSWYLLLTW